MMLRRALCIAAVSLATGLKLPTTASTRRGVLLAASSFAANPAFADEDAPLYGVATEAAARIKDEGLLKSTGKQFPPGLAAALVAGGAAAFASYKFGGPKNDTPVPTGINSNVDTDAYEQSSWVKEVDLPWMPDAESEEDAAEAAAEE